MDYMYEQYELTAKSASPKFDDYSYVLTTEFEKKIQEKRKMEYAKNKKDYEVTCVILNNLNLLHVYYKTNKINDYIDYSCIKHFLEDAKIEDKKEKLLVLINKNSLKKFDILDISYNENLVKTMQYFNVKKNLLSKQIETV